MGNQSIGYELSFGNNNKKSETPGSLATDSSTGTGLTLPGTVHRRGSTQTETLNMPQTYSTRVVEYDSSSLPAPHGSNGTTTASNSDSLAISMPTLPEAEAEQPRRIKFCYIF